METQPQQRTGTSKSTPELLRVARVAQILDVCKKRVYHLIQQGKLEVVRIGQRGTQITCQSLDNYLENLKRESREDMMK